MAERILLQYQPVQGPVWREPVAEKLQWIPEGQQPTRVLPPNRLGDYVRPEFAALYVPAGLQWLPSDRYAGQARPYSLTRWSVLDPIPPANPRLLDWQARDSYRGQSPDRIWLDWSVYPLQPIATPYDPQNLEWSPRGVGPQTSVGRRTLGDFVQPPFVSLYRPEGLEWLLEGQQPARTIPFVWQGSWVVDPTTPATVVFDPSLFPFQATDLAIAQQLPRSLRGDFAIPEREPDPNPPVPPADTGLGGSNAIHPRRVIYHKAPKPKPRTFLDRIGEPFLPLEQTPEPVPDAASAAPPPVDSSATQQALGARLPVVLPAVPTVYTIVDDSDDDDLLLLS